MHPFREAGKPTRPCPRCQLGLGSRRVLDATLDECSDCGGVFVPGDLVPRVLDPLDLGMEVVETFPRGEPEPEPAIRYLRCPRCNAMMNRRLLVRGSNVIVDQCKTHGVWFDAHELRRLAELSVQRDTVMIGEPTPAWQAEHEEREAAKRAAKVAMLTEPIESPSLLERALRVILGWR